LTNSSIYFLKKYDSSGGDTEAHETSLVFCMNGTAPLTKLLRIFGRSWSSIK